FLVCVLFTVVAASTVGAVGIAARRVRVFLVGAADAAAESVAAAFLGDFLAGVTGISVGLVSGDATRSTKDSAVLLTPSIALDTCLRIAFTAFSSFFFLLFFLPFLSADLPPVPNEDNTVSILLNSSFSDCLRSRR